jgi:uncharacterized protein
MWHPRHRGALGNSSPVTIVSRVVGEPTPERLPGFKRAGVFLDVLSRAEAVRWIAFALVGFIGAQLISIGLVTLVAAIEGQGTHLTQIANSSSPPTWYVIASLVGLWVGFLGAAVLAVNYGGATKRRFGLSVRLIDIGGLGLGVIAQLVIGLLYLPFKSHLQHFNAPITKLTGSSHGPSYVAVILLTAVGAPIVEEIFFRGVLFRGLFNVMPTTASSLGAVVSGLGAMVLDGVLFGLAHGELAQFAGLAIFGAFLSYLFLRTGRLGMSMAAHIAFNSVALWAYTASSGAILPWH